MDIDGFLRTTWSAMLYPITTDLQYYDLISTLPPECFFRNLVLDDNLDNHGSPSQSWNQHPGIFIQISQYGIHNTGTFPRIHNTDSTIWTFPPGSTMPISQDGCFFQDSQYGLHNTDITIGILQYGFYNTDIFPGSIIRISQYGYFPRIHNTDFTCG